MLGLVVLVVLSPGLVVDVNCQDPVEHIRHTGAPFLPFTGELEYYDQKLPFNWACASIVDYAYAICPDGHKCHVSDVPVGHVPMGTDPVIGSLCPDLIKVSSRYEDENACGLYEGYDDVELDFFMSTSLGYCGANMPIYTISVGTGLNRTVYFIPREEDAPSNAVIVGYVWKYPHLNNSEVNEVQAEVTKLQHILYRAITTKTPQYQYLYTMAPKYQQNYLRDDYFNEPVIGLLIQQSALSDNIRAKCPYLRQFYVYHNGLKAFIGDYIDNYSNAPEDYEETNSFYCAPYMGYCGAYLGLYRLMPKTLDTDFLITTDKAEADIKFENSSRYQHVKPTKQIVCWIWYPHRATLKSMSEAPLNAIRAANTVLHRGHWITGENKGFHVYSTVSSKFDNWENNGKIMRGNQLGLVALNSTSLLEDCPRLLRMKIYQEQNGNGRTFIGANMNPTLKTKGKWVLENFFYCAPYSGYCGATKFLWAYRSWENFQDIQYMADAQLAMELGKQDTFYSYQLCWIWSA